MVYEDPENAQEIMEELKKCPTVNDVVNLLDKTFPEIIVIYLENFCSLYPHLSNNWSIMCEKLKTPRTEIMIVKDLFFDDDHKLLGHFMNCLTMSGFMVRSMKDFVPCVVCKKIAVPGPHIHQTMKEKGVPVPNESKPVCGCCR